MFGRDSTSRCPNLLKDAHAQALARRLEFANVREEELPDLTQFEPSTSQP